MTNAVRKTIAIRKWLNSLNYVQFIGVQIALGLLCSLVLYAIISIFSISSPTREYGYSFIPFLLLFLVSAFIETLLFQYLPFILISLRKKDVPDKVFRPTRYVLISSVAFGLFHIVGTHWMMPFVVFKVLFTALYGVAFSVSFYILYKKKQKPILSVTLIHYLVNVSIVFLGFLFQ